MLGELLRRVCRALNRDVSTSCLGEESVEVGLESDSEGKHLLFWELRVGQIKEYFYTERKRGIQLYTH